jgi:hypothetical protein
MTESSNVQKERLADLLCRRASGGKPLSEQDVALLAELSPEQLAGLYEQIQMHYELGEHLGGIPSLALEVKRRLRVQCSQETQEVGGNGSRFPELAGQALEGKFRNEYRKKRKLASLLVVSVLSLLVMGFFLFYEKAPQDMGPQELRFGSADSPIEVIKSPQNEADPEVAILSSYSPELAEQEDWLHPDFGLGQSQIVLRKGWCELALRDGGVVRLLAPCTARVVDERHVFLEKGSLLAGTPSESGQITIVTEHAEIVDTGTAFAVRQGERRYPDIHVYEGQVAVSIVPKDVNKPPVKLTLKRGQSYGEYRGVNVSRADFPPPPKFKRTRFWDKKRAIQVTNTASQTGLGKIHKIAGFDLRGGTKLVVTTGTEPAEGVSLQPAIESITFAGEALTPLFSHIEGDRQITAYRMDHPKATRGDIEIIYQDRFSTGIAAYAVAGAADGIADFSVKSGTTSGAVDTSAGDLIIACFATNGSGRLIQPEEGATVLFSANIVNPHGCNVASAYKYSDQDGPDRMSFARGGTSPLSGAVVISASVE